MVAKAVWGWADRGTQKWSELRTREALDHNTYSLSIQDWTVALCMVDEPSINRILCHEWLFIKCAWLGRLEFNIANLLIVHLLLLFIDMALSCAAANCEGSALLYRWPSDPITAKAWTQWVKLKVVNFELTTTKRLCWRHFKAEDFDNYAAYVNRLVNR